MWLGDCCGGEGAALAHFDGKAVMAESDAGARAADVGELVTVVPVCLPPVVAVGSDCKGNPSFSGSYRYTGLRSRAGGIAPARGAAFPALCSSLSLAGQQKRYVNIVETSEAVTIDSDPVLVTLLMYQVPYAAINSIQIAIHYP